MVLRARRGRRGLVVLAVLAATTLALGSIFALAVSATLPSGPEASGTFDLNSTNAYFEFPNCDVVTVTWQDLEHHQVGFGVISGEAILLSDCRGPPDSDNHSCPVGWCQPGRVSLGPGPTEFENATHGWFRFTATQPGYTFLVTNPNASAPSNDSIQFTVSYSAPIVPATWAVPALLGLLGVGGAATVVVTVITVRRFRRRM
jgi:hypothetical protein